MRRIILNHGVDFWKSQGKPGKVREFNFTLEKSGKVREFYLSLNLFENFPR